MPELDLRAIEILAAVARHGSFTRAAGELEIAQASVSQRVSQLEQAVGTTLIDRKTKRATAPGRIVIGHGERASRELVSAKHEVADLLGLRGGSLRLGVIQMVAFLDLPRVIEEFYRDHPAIDIFLTGDDAEQMLSMLHAGELDLVISNVAPDEAPTSGLERVILGEESLTLIASPILTSGDSLSDALAKTPMASFGPSSAMRSTVDVALEELGVDPRVAFETFHLEMIEGLVKRGLAWTIVPDSLAAEWRDVGSQWPLPITARRRVGLSWSLSGGLEPAPVAFRDRLQASASRLLG